MALFNKTTLQGIARACSESGTAHLKDICRVSGIEITFTDEEETWRSLFEAFNSRQFYDGNRRAVLAFLRVAMQPERYRHKPDEYDALRNQLNGLLVSSYICVDENGNLSATDLAYEKIAIPVWSLVFSSYKLPINNFGLLVRLSWMPMTVAFVVGVIVGEIVYEASGEILPRVFIERFSVLLFLPFFAVYLVAWHRYVLLNMKPKGRWFYFVISKRELLFTLAGLAFFAIALPQFATSVGYLYLMSRKADLGGVISQWDVQLAGILYGVWLIVLVPIVARTFWVLPEIAIDKGFNLRRCWRFTRGNTWRLALGSVLVSAPLSLLLTVSERLFVLNEAIQALVYSLLSFFTMTLGAAILATYVSLTYRFATTSK